MNRQRCINYLRSHIFNHLPIIRKELLLKSNSTDLFKEGIIQYILSMDSKIIKILEMK